MTDYGPIVHDNEILRVLAGSGVHGIAIDGTDDRDELGVFIEPPEHVIGTRPDLATRTFRTQPEGVRSGSGDLDLVRHSLRKYLALAMKGNPNMLVPLFAHEDHVLLSTKIGDNLRRIAGRIVSRSAVHQHLGYLNGQVQRMTARHKMPNRPELVERYGYDVKYASHAIRLAIQAHELALNGRITLPMRTDLRQYVIRVKTGHYAEAEVLEDISVWERRILKAMETTPLPDKPDREFLDSWSIRTHLRYWRDEEMIG